MTILVVGKELTALVTIRPGEVPARQIEVGPIYGVIADGKWSD